MGFDNAPSIESIKDAIDNFTDTCLATELIINYSVSTGRRGAKLYPGGYACTFKLESNDKSNKDLALRIFRDKSNNVIDDIKRKLDIIRRYIKDNNLSDYFVDFEIRKNVINVKGQGQDAIIMNWVDGKTLLDYVNEILDGNLAEEKKREMMLSIAEKLKAMFVFLHKKKVSHGDLQFTNIQVDENGHLILLDYDSMFVVGLEDAEQHITGYPGFQHPLRSSNNKRSVKGDYFSEIILYMGFLVLSANVKIWEQGKNGDGERDKDYFIFTAEELEMLRQGESVEKLEIIRNLSIDDATQKTINDLVDLMIDNLKCDDLEALKPMPGIDRKFCSNCGRNINIDAKFCCYCGYEFNN